jgi:4-diphosphocytidyl-2-C-methyl-D-erythritol kinase
MSFSLPSFAKINLKLRVLGNREDGFHEVFTVLQTISLCDTITFEVADRDLELSCDDPIIPTDERNLIIRAAEKLRDRFNVYRGARIHLEKRIPSPGGLGGGSSNAAVALIGLSRLWQIEADIRALAEIAETLGSDVPFFLYGGTAVGTGKGSTMESIDDLAIGPIIVVTPDVHIATDEAYARLEIERLTSADAKSILCNYRFEAVDGLECVNDFEKTVFAAFPEIERVKRTLLGLGTTHASMSGSGASVFGIFDNEETRQTALKALGHESNWRSFAVAAISRSEYREALEIEL